MTKPAEKKIKIFLKNFFYLHKQFKETPPSTDHDAVLLFDKNNLHSYHIVVRNEVSKNILPEGGESCMVVYLKNTNPHDSRKTTRGYVRRVTQKSLLRNYEH